MFPRPSNLHRKIVDPQLPIPMRSPSAYYGSSMIGACQNTAFSPEGLSTVTWQL